jgi:hypothetical protein
MCQHSALNKVASAHNALPATSRCTGCKASISCKIKYVNKNTRKNDCFLKQVCVLTNLRKINKSASAGPQSVARKPLLYAEQVSLALMAMLT